MIPVRTMQVIYDDGSLAVWSRYARSVDTRADLVQMRSIHKCFHNNHTKKIRYFLKYLVAPVGRTREAVRNQKWSVALHFTPSRQRPPLTATGLKVGAKRFPDI